jgi:hypothetical protein
MNAAVKFVPAVGRFLAIVLELGGSAYRIKNRELL